VGLSPCPPARFGGAGADAEPCQRDRPKGLSRLVPFVPTCPYSAVIYEASMGSYVSVVG